MDVQTILANTTDYASSALSTGTNKELKKIQEIMKQLSASVTSQAATVATLSTKINGAGSGARRTTDKKNSRPSLHICAHYNQEVYHKDSNCLEMESNKRKHYLGWKSVFTEEYYELGRTVSGVGVQNWLTKFKLKNRCTFTKVLHPAY